MATQTMLVRLKPYNPKCGFFLRRFSYRGVRLQEERGWYRLNGEVGEYFRGVRQVDIDPNSPLAFDVCTEEEARALEEKERKEKRRRARVRDAIAVNEPLADDDLDDEELEAKAGEESSPDLTTADLPQNKALAKDVAKKAGKLSQRK